MSNRLTHKYAPEAMMARAANDSRFFTYGVTGYKSYPPGRHPAHCPLVKDCTAVEFVLGAAGKSRWQGCERAYINSELRFVLVFKDLRDEVILNQWVNVPRKLQVSK